MGFSQSFDHINNQFGDSRRLRFNRLGILNRKVKHGVFAVNGDVVVISRRKGEYAQLARLLIRYSIKCK